MASPPPFFWLHIKKSAGQSARRLLAPDYVEVDRSRRPTTFIAAPGAQWNDILNNFRVPLGDLQFRRALFARRHLFPQTWGQTVSFAFSRDPVRRCVSAFFNLSRDLAKTRMGPVRFALTDTRRRLLPRHREFDRFLDMIEEARASGSNFHPFGLSFSTHTAPMWDDVTDEGGDLLLRYVFRLEDLIGGINLVFDECGIERRVAPLSRNANTNSRAGDFRPARAQIARIEGLYAADFTLFEGHCTRV